jgi:hypothetical protein
METLNDELVLNFSLLSKRYRFLVDNSFTIYTIKIPYKFYYVFLNKYGLKPSLIRCFMIKKETINIIEKQFFECKYNPEYKYCQKWLMETFDSLYGQEKPNISQHSFLLLVPNFCLNI